MPNQFIRDYFTFTKRERNGIIVLLMLIILFSCAPFFYPLLFRRKMYDHSAFEKEITALKIQAADSSIKHSYKNFDNDNYPGSREPSKAYEHSTILTAELFPFDPNTISTAEWKRLGLKDKTIATIQNYLHKGGKFYKPEDLGKIWGLKEDEVKKLLPFVNIAKPGYKNAFNPFEKTVYKKEIKMVDINSGDSIAFVDLPGIGAGFARRIINFRNKLGGFVSVDQIKETYGLPDSVFQKIQPRLSFNNSTVKQININTASIDELKAHPYIRYAIANAIVQYRTQHGNFSSVNELKKIMSITDDVFVKMAPYLKVGG